ncbi:Predicted transcriptional regulator [Streptomyces sp. 2112.3]|nr:MULTISPECIES: BlaI/MecI/CopY family transcriptional regulator [unclassified Streptomyces]PBC83526.1 putative transcriptional regulator [Streptomyces sp. 2321.6]SEC99514.1 Predicted transcriptional regulator [Streptomyces sp. 2133.1]SEE75710.1 Predicted transcriptional regulator [Streptomyces sp. 2112.3]SNC69604.1 Predicted transcriptional regulator [Streptomyces sp. 2114.4]
MGGNAFGNFGGAGRERARRRGQGQLEAQVLAALHHAPGPATAAWVQERLGDDLAYTTVMTILSRLHAKQAVTRERSGRAYLWTPAADEAGLAALRMRRVLDGEPDRDAVLTSFVSALSPHDEQLLRTLLDRDAAENSTATEPPTATENPTTAEAPTATEAPTTADGPTTAGTPTPPGRHHPSGEARGG